MRLQQRPVAAGGDPLAAVFFKVVSEQGSGNRAVGAPPRYPNRDLGFPAILRTQRKGFLTWRVPKR
jgi:hypothetical protein